MERIKKVKNVDSEIAWMKSNLSKRDELWRKSTMQTLF